MIAPVNKSNFNAAIDLLKRNDLPTEDISDATHLFVITEEDNAVGTIGIEFYGDSALLRSLAVAREKRSFGLGKELVQFLETYAKDKGMKQLFLLTTTAEDYFSKKGYQIIDREEVPAAIKKSSEFSSMCPASATAMKKDLA